MPGTSLVVHWEDSVSPLQGAQFPSLVWELRSHKLCNMTREREREREREASPSKYPVGSVIWSGRGL